jgi:hypothetical protein
MVIYDPYLNIPMACADLTDDRDLDGMTYRAAVGLVASRPLVNLVVLRTELGYSKLTYQFSGLTESTSYPTRVHALPCLAGGHDVSPGRPYYVDATCNDDGVGIADGNVACTNAMANQVWLESTTDRYGKVQDSFTMNHLLRADAQSIVIHACTEANVNEAEDDLTGLCASGFMAAAVCTVLVVCLLFPAAFLPSLP